MDGIEIGGIGLDELGGGDDFTMYRIIDEVYLYLYDNGNWEVHEMKNQPNDESENATLSGKASAKWALDGIVYYYVNLQLEESK